MTRFETVPRRHAVPAQLLRDRLHLARGDSLEVHLRHGRHQRLLGPLVTLEHTRREPPLAVLRHAQLDAPHPRHQGALVVPRAIPAPAARALALVRPQQLRHLLLQNLLHRPPDHLPRPVLVLLQDRLQRRSRRRILLVGHCLPPFWLRTLKTAGGRWPLSIPAGFLQNYLYTTRAPEGRPKPTAGGSRPTHPTSCGAWTRRWYVAKTGDWWVALKPIRHGV